MSVPHGMMAIVTNSANDKPESRAPHQQAGDLDSDGERTGTQSFSANTGWQPPSS
jgi:hypothetical protein